MLSIKQALEIALRTADDEKVMYIINSDKVFVFGFWPKGLTGIVGRPRVVNVEKETGNFVEGFFYGNELKKSEIKILLKEIKEGNK